MTQSKWCRPLLEINCHVPEVNIVQDSRIVHSQDSPNCHVQVKLDET